MPNIMVNLARSEAQGEPIDETIGPFDYVQVTYGTIECCLDDVAGSQFTTFHMNGTSGMWHPEKRVPIGDSQWQSAGPDLDHAGWTDITIHPNMAERATAGEAAERPTDKDVVALFGNQRFTAQFTPQAWVNDYAVDVDAEGDQTWDCTREMAAMDEGYRNDLLAGIEAEGEVLDNDDWLQGDPDAPEWVREYQGPFSIQIRRAAVEHVHEGGGDNCNTCGERL